jgi:hypothetical protein
MDIAFMYNDLLWGNNYCNASIVICGFSNERCCILVFRNT